MDERDLKERIDELERMVESMRHGMDIETIENIRRRTLQDIVSAGVVDNATTNEIDTTSIGAGGGSVSHNVQYDKRVRVTIDGTDYYIGLYTV